MGADWAGYVMLFGQVADAVSTTFVGIESDRTRDGGCRNYGRRKTWHLFGTLCAIVSFPFIFMPCVGCVVGETSSWAMFTYYAPFVALFQFGWATIQISHLALLPEIAGESESLRVTLAARRNDFTVGATIAVYLLTWLIFGSKDNSDSGPDLDPKDASHFQLLSLILVGAGLIFTGFFHAFLPEVKLKVESIRRGSIQNDEHTELITRTNSSDRLSWFRKPLFYSLVVLYTSVRIVVNVTQTVLPLYVLETLKLPKVSFLPALFDSYYVIFLGGHSQSTISHVRSWLSVFICNSLSNQLPGKKSHRYSRMFVNTWRLCLDLSSQIWI